MENANNSTDEQRHLDYNDIGLIAYHLATTFSGNASLLKPESDDLAHLEDMVSTATYLGNSFHPNVSKARHYVKALMEKREKLDGHLPLMAYPDFIIRCTELAWASFSDIGALMEYCVELEYARKEYQDFVDTFNVHMSKKFDSKLVTV